MRRIPLVGLLLVAAVPAAWAASLQTTLVGLVGPGFEIGLRKADGGRAANLDPGPYHLEISDQGEEHNFHLTGPGAVDVRSGLDFVGSQSFDVTLVNGRYAFFCDNHPTHMRGSFTVGPVAVSPPPPPPRPTPLKLTATVGPGAAIALRRGPAKVRTVKAGLYVITVFDRSATDNFHLKGRGVDRKTGIAARGRSTWRLTLRRGALYTFSSDARRSLRGAVRAV